MKQLPMPIYAQRLAEAFSESAAVLDYRNSLFAGKFGLQLDRLQKV